MSEFVFWKHVLSAIKEKCFKFIVKNCPYRKRQFVITQRKKTLYFLWAQIVSYLVICLAVHVISVIAHKILIIAIVDLCHPCSL